MHLYYDQAFDWQALDIRADGEDTVIRINEEQQPAPQRRGAGLSWVKTISPSSG